MNIGAEMTKHGVGGEAHRLATGGVGSSPAVSIKEDRIKVLRKMLRDRDRLLTEWHTVWKRKHFAGINQKRCLQWDAERREIRERIKELSQRGNDFEGV
jgi:hypothetical protein